METEINKRILFTFFSEWEKWGNMAIRKILFLCYIHSIFWNEIEMFCLCFTVLMSMKDHKQFSMCVCAGWKINRMYYTYVICDPWWLSCAKSKKKKEKEIENISSYLFCTWIFNRLLFCLFFSLSSHLKGQSMNSCWNFTLSWFYCPKIVFHWLI